MRRILEWPRAVVDASQPATPQRILDGADGVCVLGPEVRLPCLFEMAGIGSAAGGEDVACCQRGDDGWCESEELVDEEGDDGGCGTGLGNRSIIVDIVVACASAIASSDSLSISSGEDDVSRQESDDSQHGQKSPAGTERDGEGEEEGDGARPGNAVALKKSQPFL